MNKTLIEKYKKEAVPALKEKFGYKNNLSIPFLEKIVVNAGVGRLSQTPNFEEKVLPELMKEMSLIAGQRPAPRRAKKSIAGFKLRSGQLIGLKTTLRRRKMFDFLEKLIRVVFPRLRDFRGIDLKSVDQKGNLNIGFKEQAAFPEINPETSKFDFGLEISIVSNAKKREEAVELYKLLGMPFKKNQ
ncbi:MAG: 50S ribosomal protein L5 [Patescibacteria group bacterium]